MSTNAANIDAIRRRLGHPLPDAPDDPLIWGALLDSIAHHVSELNNTSQHWSVAKTQLIMKPNVEDYTIGAENFGRPFLVYTIDPSDEFHVRCEIPMTLMQNADRTYWGPQKSNSTYPHSASQFVFYRTGNAWMVRPVPIPTATGYYECWYEVTYGTNKLEDAPGIESFHHLMRVQAALSVLPECEWRGITKREHRADWQLEYNVRRDVLLRDEEKYQKQFDGYKAQLTREDVSGKLPYGWQSEGGGLGVGTFAGGEFSW